MKDLTAMLPVDMGETSQRAGDGRNSVPFFDLGKADLAVVILELGTGFTDHTPRRLETRTEFTAIQGGQRTRESSMTGEIHVRFRQIMGHSRSFSFNSLCISACYKALVMRMIDRNVPYPGPENHTVLDMITTEINNVFS